MIPTLPADNITPVSTGSLVALLVIAGLASIALLIFIIMRFKNSVAFFIVGVLNVVVCFAAGVDALKGNILQDQSYLLTIFMLESNEIFLIAAYGLLASVKEERGIYKTLKTIVVVLAVWHPMFPYTTKLGDGYRKAMYSITFSATSVITFIVALLLSSKRSMLTKVAMYQLFLLASYSSIIWIILTCNAEMFIILQSFSHNSALVVNLLAPLSILFALLKLPKDNEGTDALI